MKIIIHGTGEDTTKLLEITKNSVEDLGLVEFIQVESSQDTALQAELSITQSPAFVIEEESISFKDMIFEWFVPEPQEITSMLLSIIGWGVPWDEDGCGWHCSSGGCGSWGCASGCC